MTRVDFYVLPGNNPLDRQRLACRLADKAYQLGHQVYVHTDNRQQAEQMNKLLWTYRQNSFVPHGILEDNGDMPPPVVLGHDTVPDDHADVLINLSNQVPEFFSRFQRVTEVINQEPDHLKLGREHYRFYQERGYPLETHKLKD